MCPGEDEKRMEVRANNSPIPGFQQEERIMMITSFAQRRQSCYCFSKMRSCHLRASAYAFTVIEIMIVVVIIAITAMVAIPMMTSAVGMQVRSAAGVIAADLEYAKSMAITRAQYFSVVFDKTTERYQIQDHNGVTIAHPVKKGFNYEVDFTTHATLNKVEIDDVDFDPGSASVITFDYLGSPYSGSGTSNPLNNGVISIRAGNMTSTISIEPVTGFVTISN